jgi:serine/threonine protein kinase
MAPEQFGTEENQRSKAADIFSLGVSFFVLTLGEKKQDREAELKKIQLTGQPSLSPAVPWIRDGMNPDLALHAESLSRLDYYAMTSEHKYGNVIKRMLAWDPSERPTAEEALSELGKLK